MGNSTLSPKVGAAAVGAAVSSLVVYFGELALKLDLPAGVEAALLTLCVAGAAFLAGYVTEDPERG